MKSKFAIVGLCSSLAVLAGCTSGTTYGTGTTHEAATMKSMYNLLAIKEADQPDIDYSARPDLVMPANKDALPAPDSAPVASDGQEWPVSPEQRIAAVRGQAPEVNDRSGDLPVEYLNSEKVGIQNSARAQSTNRSSSRADGTSRILDEIKEDGKNGGVSEEVRRRRGELAYSTGVQRKFLTEPPSEYRTPSATAQAGDLGVTSEAIEEKKKAARKERFNSERGVFNPALE